MTRPVGRPICCSWEGIVPEWDLTWGRKTEILNKVKDDHFLCVNFNDAEVDVFLWISLCLVGQYEKIMTCFVEWDKLQSCLIIFVQIIWLCLVKVQLSKILVFPTHLESESEVTQSCPNLCDSMNCSLPGTSVHGIFQARILEWVVIFFFRGSSNPGIEPRVSRIIGRRFTVWAPKKSYSY